MSEQVPEGWEVYRLGDLTHLITKGTTPKSYSNDGINFIKVESISSNHTLIPENFAKINFNTHESQKRSQLQFGDILFGIAGSLGRLAVVRKRDLPSNINQALAIIRLKRGSIDRDFCMQQLSADKFQLEIRNLQTIGAQPNLSLQQVSDFKLYKPPLPEQKKIASILTAVDEVIENTQKQIDKLQDLKKATMNELLTKGIDHTEFKDSELGEIPEGWNRLPLKKICFFQEGPGLRNWQYRKKGVRFINIRCIKNGDIDASIAQHLSVEEVEEKYQHFLLDEGDYVLSSSGTIGRLALVRKRHLPLLLNTSVIRFRSLDNSRLDSLYLRHFLQSSQFFNKISEQSQGSAQVNFGPTHLNLLYVIIPPLPEQKKIASILTSVDEVIEDSQKQVKKLQSLKKSLMQDLLTGKVRVVA